MVEWIFAHRASFMPGMIQREVLPGILLTNLGHTTGSAIRGVALDRKSDHALGARCRKYVSAIREMVGI